MNLALRDVRHNAFRFVLTGLGLGGLLGIVVAMAGIYAGALDDALRFPRASSPDLWVVQPRTKGPFAEPSRIPRDTRELVRRIPGVAEAGAVTFQTVQATANGKPLRLFIQGYEPSRLGGPERTGIRPRDHAEPLPDRRRHFVRAAARRSKCRSDRTATPIRSSG